MNGVVAEETWSDAAVGLGYGDDRGGNANVLFVYRGRLIPIRIM